MTGRSGINEQSKIARPGYSKLNVRNFLRKVSVGSCWEWTGYRTPTGYGRLTVNGAVSYAHRVVWEMFVGPIPAGLDMDHLCRNRGCVNPDHLQPVTRQMNVSRGAARHHVHRAREARYGTRAA